MSLGHPKSMLLVHDGKPQLVKRDVILEQGVGADRHLGCAGRQRPELLGPRRTLVAPGQQDHVHAVPTQGFGDRFIVLTRQDLRRRHQRALAAAGCRVGYGAHGDDRLA